MVILGILDMIAITFIGATFNANEIYKCGESNMIVRKLINNFHVFQFLYKFSACFWRQAQPAAALEINDGIVYYINQL